MKTVQIPVDKAIAEIFGLLSTEQQSSIANLLSVFVTRTHQDGGFLEQIEDYLDVQEALHSHKVSDGSVSWEALQSENM